MSAGELFDLIRPAVVFASVFISTCILISARRRFPFYQAILWAATALFLPLVVAPLYLVVLIFKHWPRIESIRGRFAIPILYLTIIVSALALYEYFDSRSVDAHLARAAFAKVNSRTLTAIKEYRAALQIEDSPHTHKLLAESLMEAGFLTEAITEFRAAELHGEPDDLIHFNLGLLLERINHKGEATIEFKTFLMTETCSQVDYRCEAARQRITDYEETR